MRLKEISPPSNMFDGFKYSLIRCKYGIGTGAGKPVIFACGAKPVRED